MNALTQMLPSQSFLNLADVLPEAIILLSGDGEILAINKFARNLINKNCDNIESLKNLSDLFDNSEASIDRMLRNWSRSRIPVPAALRWKKRDNQKIQNLKCEAFLVKPSTGNELSEIILRCVVGKDQVNEFSLLNNELEKTQNTLRKLLATTDKLEKESELSTVTLQSIADAVITTDVNGCVESLNPVAEKLSGWFACDAIGKPSGEVFKIINELTRETPADLVRMALDQEKVVESEDNLLLISKDGTEFVIEETVAPIKNKVGKIFGAVLVFRDVTGDRLANRQLEHLAQHDFLTGLHNRYYFEQELGKAVDIAKRNVFKFGILYIDLDEFKAVNDTAGHSVGDSLLTDVSRLFSTRLRRGDTLARLGGDEFAILLQNIEQDQLLAVGRSYQQALEDYKFNWKEKSFIVTPSVGASFVDSSINSAAEALRQADVACYAAKQDGKNRLHVYNKNDDTEIGKMGEASFITKINDALVQDTFVLYFQPIQNVDSTVITHYEVLIRMKGKNGILTPNVFLPVAERYGLMPKIDKWVIENTLSILKKLPASSYILSINLSGASFEDKDIVRLLSEQLKNNRALAESIIFEVTETSAISHIESASDFMRKLRNYGVKFALDDFGTGFSSFTYLKHLPVDFIKIDGTFVRDIAVDPNDQAMVRSINHIAHSLNKKTIAEYVEDDQIQAILEEIGVDYLQGYNIGRPDPNILPEVVWEEKQAL